MKKCKLCRAEIPDEATYCSHCNMHQSPWKNWIPHITNALALLSFIAAMSIWGIEKGTNFFTRITWKDDIKVIAYNSSKNLTMKNIGDGPVFIERIDILVEKTGTGKGFLTTTSIEKILEKEQIASFAIGEGIGEVGGDILIRTNEFNPDNKDLANLLEGTNPNIQRLVLNKNNGHLLNYKYYARENAITFNGEATIYYFSIFNDSAKTVKFDCEVVFVKLK